MRSRPDGLAAGTSAVFVGYRAQLTTVLVEIRPDAMLLAVNVGAFVSATGRPADDVEAFALPALKESGLNRVRRPCNFSPSFGEAF